MAGHERRVAKRYVIGGLYVEIGGVVHDTVDVSRCAMAVLFRDGVDYVNPQGSCGFVCDDHVQLNASIQNVRFIGRRGPIVVLGYDVDRPDVWDEILAHYDVRADLAQLEDVFG